MKNIYTLILVLAFTLVGSTASASQGVVMEWEGGCLSFTKTLSVGKRDIGKNSDIKKLQAFLNYQSLFPTVPTGYFGPSTAKALKDYQKAVRLKQTGTLNVETRIFIKKVTCGGAVQSQNSGKFKIDLKTIGVKEEGAGSNLQVNLSLTGGTLSNPVTEWKIYIECPEGVDVGTVPGDACGEFNMGSAPGTDGNVIAKEFWIKNNTNKNQIVRFKAQPITASGAGQTNTAVVNVPVTVVGPTSWSQMKLLSQNNGDVYKAGDGIDVMWKTSPGYYNFETPATVINISVMKDRMRVYRLEGLVNDGYERITLPSTLEAGSDYNIDVAAYLGEHGQSDQNDKPFTVTR